jgi:hypothetical protein
MKIRPILTPDNYVEHIMPLIMSAKRSFYPKSGSCPNIRLKSNENSSFR